MIKYLNLLRIKHYIKNLLIFSPLFFSGSFFSSNDKLVSTGFGFLCFCFLSSAVYILNDYKDMEKDRNHPTKKFRPLASGEILPRTALWIMLICLSIVLGISFYLKSWQGGFCLILYFALNIAYSLGLKNLPIIDIAILSSGFLIRLFYGDFISNTEISKWLYLVVLSGSLYMGLGKRRNEFRSHTETRGVLKSYNDSFLDKNMYVCMTLVIVFYALWTFESSNANLSWTVPVFILIFMRYSLDVEGDSDGDPIEVILKDKELIFGVILYILVISILIYL